MIPITEKIALDLKVGDIVLGGKWKNKRIIVKSIGKDSIGQPTINGKSLLNFRIEKDLPDDMKSKKTKEEQDLKEGSARRSFEYYRTLRKSNPALFKVLAQQSKLAIEAMKKNMSIEKAQSLLSLLLSRNKNVKPAIMTDTYGVNLVIDSMLTDPEERAAAKRYYKKMTKSAPAKQLRLTTEQLRKFITEAALKEIRFIASEQKRLSESSSSYLKKLAPLKEYAHLDNKKALLEFFGPFKKLSVDDLRGMSQGGAAQAVVTKLKAVDANRKRLSTVKLSDVSAVEDALESYVNSLLALWGDAKKASNEKITAQAKKAFGAAAFVLQSLQSALMKASNTLFTKVPMSSGMFASADAEDLSHRRGKIMQTPGQQAAGVARAVTSGGGPGGPGIR